MRRRLSEAGGEESAHNVLHVKGLNVSSARHLFFRAPKEEIRESLFSTPPVGRLVVADE